MKRLLGILLVGLGLSAATWGEEPIWRCMLDTPGPVFHPEKTNGQLDGALPVGLGPNYFGWQKSRVKTSYGEEAGKKFCSMHVSNALAVGPQFVLAIPKLEEGKYYRLTATVRNFSRGRFSLYLREKPAPYRSLGAAVSIEPSGEWETHSAFVKFHKPASDQYGLFCTLDSDGRFDLREFSITEATAAEYRLQGSGGILQNIVRPCTTWRNFLASSCFPWGVPAGWNCRRGTATVSDDMTGPSGQRALLLEPGEGEKPGPVLFSSPFQTPDPAKVYTVSFSYKGAGRPTCNGKTFAASDTWQRAQLDIQVAEDRPCCVLEFSADGPFFLDAVRVSEKGETSYSPAGKCEIALGVPRSEASEARIQFDDEQAGLVYQLVGDFSGVVLRGTVTNLWGETRDLPEIRPTAATGKLDYLLFPETPFGQFRVNLQAFAGEKPCSMVAEYVVSRFRRPVYWGKDAPHSPFGIHEEAIPQLLTGLKAGGMNWIRLHDGGFIYCMWTGLEPEKGKWTFFDSAIQTYRKSGMMLYGQLGGAPLWASYYANTEFQPDGYRKYFSVPTDEHLPDFEHYAYTVVKHYENDIHDWFVWNEPWGGGFFHRDYDKEKKAYIGFENQGEAYAKVMKAAYRGAKRANPNVRVTGFSTFGNGTQFTSQIVDAGGYEACDEIDYHEYVPRTFGFPDDGNREILESAFGPIVQKYGKIDKAIIMSEGSPLSNGSNQGAPLQGMYRHVLPWDNNDRYNTQADDVVRYVMSLLGNNVKRVFLYTAHGHQNLTRSAFQVLLGADGYPHPTLAAMSTFTYHAEDSRFVAYKELCPHVYAALFQKNDGSSFAVITGKRQAWAKIHCSLAHAKGEDLYGNPLTFPMEYHGFLLYVISNETADVLRDALSGTPEGN
ncbi:MAG: hypothetical protein Q4D98_03205 [Planctomycetia bacterium]|nr:hypothetical protein [Planctomycetia bacterium]